MIVVKTIFINMNMIINAILIVQIILIILKMNIYVMILIQKDII